MVVHPKQIWAPLPGAERSRSVHLSIDPKGEKIAYAYNKSIYLRSIDDPAESVQYNQHRAPTTVAKFSPSGYYVASADVHGTVRIWDAVGEDNVLKNETTAFAGRVNDLAWDGESKRIIAVGDGKQRSGHCFTFDSGNTVGEISGHTAALNSVSIRHDRPYRAVTAGDDNAIVFHTAFPCKYEKTLREHSRFVHEVRFSPDGSVFVSAGGDQKICVWDGKTADLRYTLPLEDGHKGSVLAVSFDRSGNRMLTSSADRTVKLWDLEAQKLIQTWTIGESGGAEHQQLGNACAGDQFLSLSLSGNLNYLDPSSNKISRTICGHQRAVTSMGSHERSIFTGSYEGKICQWSMDSGAAEVPTGKGHTNEVVAFAKLGKDMLSAGKDDQIKTIDPNSKAFSEQSISCEQQPLSISSTQDGMLFVVSEDKLVAYHRKKKTGEIKLPYTATTLSTSSTLIAVGAENNSVHLYNLDLSSVAKLEANRTQVTALSFSPTGQLLAAGGGDGKIVLYDTEALELKTARWSAQTGRIRAMAWNSEGTHLVSASLDTSIVIYSVASPLKKVTIMNAHMEGVSGVVWADQATIYSTGADAAVKKWSVDNLA